MISFFALAALALLPAVIAQQLTVNTPVNVVQCEPVQITWSGGTPPYFLSFVPAGQTSAPALKQFPSQNGTSLTYKVDLSQGTTFTIVLKDGNGVQAFSDIVTVQSGPDTSCINTSVSDSGTGGTAAPTSGGSGTSPSAPASTTGGGSSTASAGTKSSSGASSPSSTSAPASSSTGKPNGAYNNKLNAFALAGVMGLVGAALF